MPARSVQTGKLAPPRSRSVDQGPVEVDDEPAGVEPTVVMPSGPASTAGAMFLTAIGKMPSMLRAISCPRTRPGWRNANVVMPFALVSAKRAGPSSAVPAMPSAPRSKRVTSVATWFFISYLALTKASVT